MGLIFYNALALLTTVSSSKAHSAVGGGHQIFYRSTACIKRDWIVIISASMKRPSMSAHLLLPWLAGQPFFDYLQRPDRLVMRAHVPGLPQVDQG